MAGWLGARLAWGCTSSAWQHWGESWLAQGCATPFWACSHRVSEVGLSQLLKAQNHTLSSLLWDCCCAVHPHPLPPALSSFLPSSPPSLPLSLSKVIQKLAPVPKCVNLKAIQVSTNGSNCSHNIKLTLPARYRESKN